MTSLLMRNLICFLLFAVSVAAQSVTGVISGTVTDVSKAAIPQATVSIVNADSGAVAFRGRTNQSGIYRAPELPVGRYNIAIEAPSFRRAEVAGVHLDVDQRADISVTLQLGATAEVVNVAGETQGQLATESSSLGSVINTSQVQDLPLPNRNILNLLTLTPGVSSGGASTGINSAQLSINGSRTLNSEFTVDGVSVVSGSTGAPQSLPPADAVREFKVLTSAYSAEYGRTSGGTVSVIVRSGENQFHGALYEYFRNEDLNANDYFRNLRGDPRASDRYNLFGAKLGGPIWIPKLYKGHDRTFCFVNYEGLRRETPYNNISSLPDAPFRLGDFSRSPIPIDMPETGTPFPGNRIPAGLIDPAAAKILGVLPLPNSSGSPDLANGRAVNNYVASGSSAPSNDTVTTRIDHAISEKVRLFGTLTHYSGNSPIQPIIPGPLENAVNGSVTTGYQAAFGYTHAWTPTLITDLRLGFFRNNSEILPPSLGLNVANVLGIQRSVTDVSPVFNIGGYAQLGINSNTFRQQIDNNFQTTATAAKSAGNHLYKFGFDLRKNQFNDFNPGGNYSGIYGFTGDITSPTHTSGNPVNSLADFLLGRIKTASYALSQPIVGRRNYNLGIFAQDDWKLTPKLTLNLGLRWEHESPIVTSNGIYSRVDPATGQVLFAGKNASDSLNLTSDKLDFAPRAGFAYAVNPKTVIRSGFGIFYSQIFSDLGGQVLFPGYTVTQSHNSLGVGVAQPFTLSQGQPLTATQNLSKPQANLTQFTPANPLSAGASFAQVNPLPRALQWNFGVQREIARGTILNVNYVGSRGLHLPLNLPNNSVPIAQGTTVAAGGTSAITQNARPFPNVGGFSSIYTAGTSTYHGLQITAQRQYTTNLAFVANYTYSKSIDDGSGIYSFSQPTGLNAGQYPNLYRNLDRGLSEFDRTHIFSGAIQLRTAGNRWIGGWELSPILVARTGLPITVNQNNLNSSSTQTRPNLLDSTVSIYAKQTGAGTAIRYLLLVTAPKFPLGPVGPLFTGSGNTRTLIVPAGIGTLGRDTYRSPGELNLDLSVSREFTLREHLRLQVRAEAFNFLNHTNFQPPNSTLAVAASPTGQPIFNSPDFGLITAANPARFLQLVARIEF